MASSNLTPPKNTSANSPQTLPMRGFTTDQLAAYVFRQLGAPVWEVELTKQQILDAIQDSLQKYSVWVPAIGVGSVQLERGRFQYLQGEDVGQGIINVSFVEPNPVPTEIFYGNLISPAPLFRVGLDEYDTFLRWRKVWQRVTSVKPDWYYDEVRKALYIHNPIERYQAGVSIYTNWPGTEGLDMVGSLWVKEYSLERARYNYGEILAKYGNAIPGPLQELKLDTQKRENAEKRLEKLEEKLQGMQRLTPVSMEEW